MKKITNILTGADIEVFFMNKLTEEIVSAEPYIQGTKEKPFCFDKRSKFHAVSLDNILAEFCIPPSKTKAEFYKNITHAIDYINTVHPDYCALSVPSAFINPVYLQTENAKLFGCTPDMNAYTLWQNPVPKADDDTLRGGGGHIHYSYDNPSPMYDTNNPDEKIIALDEERHVIVRTLDAMLAVPMVIIEPPNRRKELYGKAGAFRPKPYGLEYRTLSNYYTQTKGLTEWVFTNGMEAMNRINNGFTIEPELATFIQETINNNNTADAEYLIKTLKIKMPKAA